MNNFVNSCDDCGESLFYIKGLCSEELFDLINNDKRIVDNTEILCFKCFMKRVR